MLTGRQAFEGGETVSDAIAAILTREPDLNAVPVATPAPIRTLLRRCLQKSPQKRLPHIGIARLELDDLIAGGSGDATTVAGVAQPVRSAIAIAAAPAAAIASVAVWVIMRAPSSPRPVIRLEAPLPAPLQLGVPVPDIALSPDGTRLALVAGAANQLFVRALGDADAKPLNGIEGVRSPFFSPDGAWIGYFQANDLKKVSSEGGPPVTICRVCAGGNRGGTWGTDDTIIFASGGGTRLNRVQAAGGEATAIGDSQSGAAGRLWLWPGLLPGGQSLLFTVASGVDADRSQLLVRNLKTGTERTLVRGAAQAHYSATGHIVYAAAGTLRAIGFDARRLETSGNPVPVLDRVLTKNSAAADFGIGRDGTLAFVSGSVIDAGLTILWRDRAGHEEPTGMPPRRFTMLRLSPDGHRAALDLRDQEFDIWTWDFSRRLFERLTVDPANDQYPLWTPDGQRIVFRSDRGGVANLYWQLADHTGAAERLTQSPNQQLPYAFSPDGKWLVFVESDPKTAADLYIVPMTGERTAKPLIRTPFNETSAAFSPDGQWIAYQSDESGAEEVYVRPFPAVDAGRSQISSGGGSRPVWARNGRELFYVDARSRLIAAPIQLKPTFAVGNAVVVFENVQMIGGVRPFDVAPDGRFLIARQAAAGDQTAEPPRLHVVLNWGEELKARAPVK